MKKLIILLSLPIFFFACNDSNRDSDIDDLTRSSRGTIRLGQKTYSFSEDVPNTNYLLTKKVSFIDYKYFQDEEIYYHKVLNVNYSTTIKKGRYSLSYPQITLYYDSIKTCEGLNQNPTITPFRLQKSTGSSRLKNTSSLIINNDTLYLE